VAFAALFRQAALRDEDFLIPGMFIRKPQTALLTSACAFAAKAAATPGETNLRIQSPH